MGNELGLTITATEENWAHGGEVDVREALADLNLELTSLLAQFITFGISNSVTITGEDQVWNEGTEDEAVVEPKRYTFTLSEVRHG